jgi:DNA-binding transcriptional ArsR family regulator
MVQYIRTGFDASFAALSDATRRGVLEQLGRADASITDLAEKFHMTLTGMKKHVGVLEQAGGTEVDRRVPAFLRGGCSCRGQVPFRVRPRGLKDYGVLR